MEVPGGRFSLFGHELERQVHSQHENENSELDMDGYCLSSHIVLLMRFILEQMGCGEMLLIVLPCTRIVYEQRVRRHHSRLA
jgi:hypothetical protein